MYIDFNAACDNATGDLGLGRRIMSNADKYFEGFEKVERYDAGTGKRKKEFIYTGNYYRLDLNDSERKVLKMRVGMAAAAYILIYLFAAFLNTGASKTFYVGMMCLLMLIPGMFLIGAVYEMLTAGEYMIARKFKGGIKRLRTVSVVLLVLSAWQIIGELIYIFLHIKTAENMTLEVEYLMLAAAETFLMAVVYMLSGKPAVDEIPNEFVDEKTGTLKTAENVKEVLTKEPEISGEYSEALEVAKLILAVYESDDFEVETKDYDSPLTKADRLANDKIVEMLRGKFPNYAILSEEEEDNKDRLSNPYCFVVDPLDGTKEFIKRNGEFTVNIALAKDHKSVMGVIYIPVTDELFFAAEGAGAFYRDKDGKTRKIKVSSRLYSYRDRKNFRAVSSRSHESDEMKALFDKYHIDNVVRIGSSIKGCLVARGDAEVYYRYGLTKEWDTAAMQCIVEQAGGVFRQMDDSEMRYNRENTLNELGFYVLNKKENRLI